MKKNSLILIVILLTFLIPFATSFLLEFPIIETSVARSILVWLFLIFQILFGIAAVKNLIKSE